MAPRSAPNETPAPPWAEEARARVRAGLGAKRATHGELVRLLRCLVGPHETAFARWSTLRRALALAGHRTTLTHMIARALWEVVPTARMGRLPPQGRGPRGVFGVVLTVNLERMRATLAPKWEREVAIPPEPVPIAMEYKLGPLPANDNGDAFAGRLSELVRRVQHRRADATAYYGLACDYLHRSGVWAHFPGHKAVWALHCEGCTRYEIAKELGLNENKVQSIVDLHRARCGLVHR